MLGTVTKLIYLDRNIHARPFDDQNQPMIEDWKLLVEQLGLEKATQFALLLKRGKGDTVQDIIKYWGNASIEEIHGKVMAQKILRNSPVWSRSDADGKVS